MSKNGKPNGKAIALRHELTDPQRLFALEYIRNGGNGTRAYLSSHPRCRSEKAAAVEAHRYLKNPKVIAILDRDRTERFKRMRMDADEALALISATARADIRQFYDEHGELLPVHLWPKSARLAVRGVKHKDGQLAEVVLQDPLRARELMALAGGKLKQTIEHRHTLAFLLSDAPIEEDDDGEDA